MKICFIGSFDRNYPRNRNLINGLKKNNCKIVFCQNSNFFIQRFISLYWLQKKYDYDLLFVPYSQLSAVDVIMVKVFSIIRKKPLIFDAYISLIDTYVYDKKYLKKNELKTYIYYIIEYLALILADHIICDTTENIKYFLNNYKLKKSKFDFIFVGTDENLFQPSKTNIKKQTFLIGYWGNYIPLHGVEYIVTSAKYYKHLPIQLMLLGSGQSYQNVYKKVEKLGLKNIKFLNNISYNLLPYFIHSLKIALVGPFGRSDKADRVLPNKLFEALASHKVIIVNNSKLMTTIFRNQEVIFCPKANAKELSRNIIKIYKNYQLFLQNSKIGYNWFLKNATQKLIGEKAKAVFLKVFKKNYAIK